MSIKSRGVFEMLQLPTIKRWAIVEMVKEQSVAEHVYRVWVLTSDLLGIMEDVPHNSFETQATQFRAITHDMEEVFTGDIPTTAKEVLEQLEPGITKRLRDEILAKHFPFLCSQTRGVDNTLAARYVKIAELAESILYVRRYAVDKNKAIEVENTLQGQLVEAVHNSEALYSSIPWERCRAWIRELLTPPPIPYSVVDPW